MLSSSISWLDFSESERRKMIEIISLFRERDTRDELGIGSVRDSIADQLFPGTSTLQTRARYFLFIPWLYKNYENTRVPSAKIRSRLRSDEISIINALGRAGETIGVIGQRSGVSLHRFPSSIYWVGLQKWGICRFPGSQDQYYRSLDRLYEYKRQSDADEIDLNDSPLINWDKDLPPRPDNFPFQADFSLKKIEAEYLKDRLLLSCTNSLLPYLVEQPRTVEDAVQFPWFHPFFDAFPMYLQNFLVHARNFSETIHGASLLYNFLLSKQADNDELALSYQTKLDDWHTSILEREESLKKWDRIDFWKTVGIPGVKIPAGCRRFVDEWMDHLLTSHRIPKPEQSESMKTLVKKREEYLKGDRSRFKSKRHLEIWSGASSAGQLDYRWRIARRISNDILAGLHPEEGK